MEQEKELGANIDVSEKPETRALPSNPDEDDSKGMKELVTEQKNKMEKKLRKQGN